VVEFVPAALTPRKIPGTCSREAGKVKVKVFLYQPDMALGVPGG
jgi:hypothetical protein